MGLSQKGTNMDIHRNLVDKVAALVKANQSKAGLIIWIEAKKYCGSNDFETYKHELARLVGLRGGNHAAKKNNERQLKLDI